ncbi:hypothetical protein [Clostridium prolinivorans]|jgi:NifU-like protein involved in Fe-S cluster formation|uniref:hypothetical protein n=1 Tax=Clostridium prolinivorans TaxID=2769420 RepID=UPI000FDCB14E|nr:hypothetical protein [Clostridium prolinivorans]
MKKKISVLLATVFAFSMLSGCANKGETTPAANNDKPAATEPAKNNENTKTEGNIVKLGLGHITSISKSKDLETGKGALGQVDTSLVAAGFDKDGKVVSITIDNAQTKVEFNDDLSLKTDVKAAGQTKVELKDKYGMIKASKIQKEWYQQAEALEKWMVGKTVDEIKAMKTKKVNDEHPQVPDVPELTSSVTINVGEYIEAVEEAYKNAIDVTGGVKVGLGHEISSAKSTGLNGDKTPLAQVDTSLVAAAFDKDGKVVGAIIDSAQTKVPFDKNGKVTVDKTAPQQTKVELKDKYGMIKGSKIQKEWYQQAEALQKWMVGKTVDEITSMKTKKVNDEHPQVPDVPELTSSVTINVGEYLAALKEAYTNAK